MKRIRDIIRSVIRESADDRYQLIYYSDEYDDLDDIGIDAYEAADIAGGIAKDGGVNILRNQELTSLLVDTNMPRVIGGLWVSHDNDKFSFDIAIDSGYQNMGLSKKLIDAAISEFEMQKDAFEDANEGEEFKMEVDVINPKLAKILQNKYGFYVVGQLSQDRVLMSI